MEEFTDMLKPTRVWVAFVVSLLVFVALPGCGGDDENDDQQTQQRPVDGSFVGKASGSDVFVAVVAAPAAKGKDTRDVSVYVSDGARVSESYAGSIKDNSFTAASPDDAEAKGELAGDSVKGSVELPDGKSVSYEAGQAAGAAGLYELTVSRKGTLSGASAAGIGLTSKSELRAPGTGTLKFADGKRRKFEVVVASGGEPGRVRVGHVRLIVLTDGQMKGAGVRQAQAGDAEADFYVASAAS
jgi:hypothetical protein